MSEKIRFISDSKKISSTLQKLHSANKFDVIESPNNGACFDRINNHYPTCIRIATTDKEHSLINKTEITPYLKELFRAEAKTFRNCRNLVTHTKAHRDNICNEYKIEPENFSLIPLSVRIPDESELNYSEEGDKNIVLFVGRFEERKGIDILLDLIPDVVKRIPSTIFRLVGPDPKEYYKCKFKNEHPDLINNVFFLGEKRGVDLDQEYKNCNIFIAPSRYESFGLIYAEAMSFSKPVIGTNIGGIPEVIENQKSGFLCKNEDKEDFINKLLILLRNADLRYRMGLFARKKTIESFKFENMVTKTIEYYHNLKRKL